MSSRFLISAIAVAGFWRCGRQFTQSGVLVDAGDFTAAQWDRLKAEPMLRIKPVSDEDAVEVTARAEQIADTIATLVADDFQRDGRPKLDSLNALLGADLGKITGAERDQVFDAMKENGFVAPAKAAGTAD